VWLVLPKDFSEEAAAVHARTHWLLIGQTRSSGYRLFTHPSHTYTTSSDSSHFAGICDVIRSTMREGVIMSRKPQVDTVALLAPGCLVSVISHVDRAHTPRTH
jgi:hypothetical protein